MAVICQVRTLILLALVVTISEQTIDDPGDAEAGDQDSLRELLSEYNVDEDLVDQIMLDQESPDDSANQGGSGNQDDGSPGGGGGGGGGGDGGGGRGPDQDDGSPGDQSANQGGSGNHDDGSPGDQSANQGGSPDQDDGSPGTGENGTANQDDFFQSILSVYGSGDGQTAGQNQSSAAP